MEKQNFNHLKNNLCKVENNGKNQNIQHKINLEDYCKKAQMFYANKQFNNHQLTLCEDFLNIENESFVLYEKFLLGE